MRLSQRTERTEFESFVSVYEPLINNWSNVPTAQTPILVLFLSAGVLFDGAFSLWVSLKLQKKIQDLQRRVAERVSAS